MEWWLDSRSREPRIFGYAWSVEVDESESLLISVPMNVKGAQQDNAQGMPHIATMTVAARRDVTNGAIAIEPAKMRCEHVHAVKRVGLYFSTSRSNRAMLTGGRGVNSGDSCSEDSTSHGIMTELAKVITEKATKDKLPIRPI